MPVKALGTKSARKLSTTAWRRVVTRQHGRNSEQRRIELRAALTAASMAVAAALPASDLNGTEVRGNPFLPDAAVATPVPQQTTAGPLPYRITSPNETIRQPRLSVTQRGPGAVQTNAFADAETPQTLPEVVQLFQTFDAATRSTSQPGVSERSQALSAAVAAARHQSTQPKIASGEVDLVRRNALEQLHRAMEAYRKRSWRAAEEASWTSLELTARAVDLEHGKGPVSDTDPGLLTTSVHQAKTAIKESHDFANLISSKADATLIGQLMRSHKTRIQGLEPGKTSAARAVDLYLDSARRQLGEVASYSVEAAESLDLLASIYLRRDQPRELPAPTAVCMLRAALQGQPGNASLAVRLAQHLASAGLADEAARTYEHALSIEPLPETAASLVALLDRNGETRRADRWRGLASDSSPKPSAGGRQTSRTRVAVRPETPAVRAAAAGVTPPAALETAKPESQSKNPLKRISDSFRKFW